MKGVIVFMCMDDVFDYIMPSVCCLFTSVCVNATFEAQV